MTTSTEQLRLASKAFAQAFADAALDPLVLVLWVADLHTNACLEAIESGAYIRRLHAGGELAFRLTIDQAKGRVSLIGVTTDGREVVLYEIERGAAIPDAMRRAFFEQEEKLQP